MAYDVKATWMQLDVESLDPKAFKAYNDYKDAYRAMKAARELFEATMSAEADLPATSKLVFGYNFGKLSIAVVPNDKPKASSTKPAQSLAAFLAAQSAQGRRS